MGLLTAPEKIYDGATSLVDIIRRQFGDDIDGATQELVRQVGFPEPVARRIATGELPMDEASRVARREARYADEGLVHVNRGGIKGEGFDNERLPWDDPDTPFNAHWFTTDPHPSTAFRGQGSDDPLTYTPVVLEKGRRGDWRDVVRYGESMGEDAGYGTEFREGLLDNGVSDLVVRGGDKIDQSTIDALPDGGRLKVDPDNKYGDRRNSLVKNEDGSLGFYEGPEHILDYDDLADYQRFNPEIQDVAVLDNTIIRSPNAAFDPEYTGSNIMGNATVPLLGATAAGTAGLLAAPVLMKDGIFQHTASDTPIVERKKPVRNQSSLLESVTDFGDEVFKSVRHAAGPVADVLMPFEGVNNYLKAVNDYDRQPTWQDRLGLLDF